MYFVLWGVHTRWAHVTAAVCGLHTGAEESPETDSDKKAPSGGAEEREVGTSNVHAT